MVIKPFRAWRPRPGLASKIPSYPYDVLSSAEARQLAAGDPYTFLHVIKPEIDLDPSIDPYDDRVYVQGSRSFAMMREREETYSRGGMRDAAAQRAVLRTLMDVLHEQRNRDLLEAFRACPTLLLPFALYLMRVRPS